MNTASSQRYTANWVIKIVLAIFLFLTSIAGFTVIRALILVGDLSSLTTQSRADDIYPSRIQP
jgi:hypothetical protein